MTQKSSLKPLFALSFLAIFVILCCLSIYAATLFGGAYALQSANPPALITANPLRPTQQLSPGIKPTITMTITNKPVFTQVKSTVEQASATAITQKTFASTVLSTTTQTLEPTILPTEKIIPTPVETATSTEVPTPLPSATENLLPTVDPKSIAITQAAKATADTQDMVNVIAKLYTDGIIHSTSGTFHSLPEFEGDWNDTGTYQKTDSGYNISNFVIKADAGWEVDGLQGNWSESGCGVIFREADDDNYYLVFWSLDGRARLMRKMSSGLVLLGRSTIFDVDRNVGQAKVMIVAEDEWIRIYVNGVQKFEKRGDTKPGKMEFTVVSGNSKGYGTYCHMSNIGLWEIK